MSRENKVTLQGIILRGKSGPAKKIITDNKTGKEIPIMWFTVKYNDCTWRDENTGKTQYNEKYIKCFLPRNQYGESQFRNISGGRHIATTGTLKADIYQRKDRDGNTEYLPAMIMNNASVDFLDSPLNKQAQTMIEVIDKAGLIDENGHFKCDTEEFKNTINKHSNGLKGITIKDICQQPTF